MGSRFSYKDEATEESGNLEGAPQEVQETVDHLFNVSLHIAVIGETGAGKSTFINAFRGLEDDDEGAAKTGVNETTAEPTPYNHPTMSNVTLWDLPGVGSLNFTARTYVKEMQFEKYDFFFVVSSERFRENDIMLAKEIQKGNKRFYFIRSKVDNDIRGEERKKTFDREETLSKIRRDCQENLKELGNPPVFLISSCNLSEFDFEKLVSTLNSELPQHKQYALVRCSKCVCYCFKQTKNNIIKK
uniref:IRG-type G domain-containing protein n=1 Tax=Astyanax mexicanus TaxID=7994 RepID=A0A3B1ICZ9_ASTMX